MHLANVASVAAVLLVAACALTIVAAAPYQELKPRAGWVPVYIRVGETPLSEIHPGLAEAFNEIESLSLTQEKQAGSSALDVKQTTTAEPLPTPVAVAEEQPESSTTSKTTTESDIASFDVVKGDRQADDNASNAVSSETDEQRQATPPAQKSNKTDA